MSEYEGPKPPDWPRGIPGPGADGGAWEQAAVKWLWELAPGEWRTYRTLREYPLMLARDTRYLIEGQLQALRNAYARARVELGTHFEPHQIEEQLAMYSQEGPRLAALARQVQLVEDALSGIRWLPR